MQPGLFYAAHAARSRPVAPLTDTARPRPRVDKPQASARDRSTSTRWSLFRWHSSRAASA